MRSKKTSYSLLLPSNVWDWNEWNSLMIEVRNENPVEIVLKRNDSVLKSQLVRISRTGGPAEESTDKTVDLHLQVAILGEPNLDILRKDRFCFEGRLYIVTEVMLEHGVAKRAFAELYN